MRAFPVLLSLLSTSPSADAGAIASFTEPTKGWQVEPALDLAEAVTRGNDAPVFTAEDGGICVDMGRWWGDNGNKHWVWVHCPAAPGHCQKLISSTTDVSVLGERCSKDAVAFAELELASCGQGDFESLLRQSSSMRIHVPKLEDETLKALRRATPYSRGVVQSESIGCAETVTSPDGRLRVWTLRTAVQEGSPSSTSGSERGLAYLQWLTPKGHLKLLRNEVRGDLYLDATLDGITPLPDNPQEYLVTGYSILGFDYLRFAEVITLAGARPTLAKGRFLVDGQAEDVLIVTGGVPETGKPRHSPVNNHFLQLKGRRLWAEPLPGDGCCSPVQDAFVLGEWTGKALTMKEGGWAQLLKLRGTRVIHPASRRKRPTEPSP